MSEAQLFDRESNIRKTDIILKLKVMEGKKPVATSGFQDARLFNGANCLHAKLDTQVMLWYLQYDTGTIPGGLQGRWTSFDRLLTHTQGYLSRRNIEIVEILD